MAAKFDIPDFFKQPDSVALNMAASEVFGLLKRSLDLPPGWAALVTRKTGDHVFVPASGQVEGADAEDVLFVRVTPMEVAIEEADLATDDKFQCRAQVQLQLSPIADASELASFRRAILGSERMVLTNTIERYVQPAVRTALTKLASEHAAGDLVDPSTEDMVSAALAEALRGPCFAAGIALEAKPTARFESPTLQQIRIAEEGAARRQAEHEATHVLQEALHQAQSKHLDHLASMLSRSKELAEASPGVELSELLRTFSERERGELYEALFAAEAPSTRTQWIVAATADELLFFEPGHSGAPSRRVKIAGAAGPVRSIQMTRDSTGQPTLFLGASSGIYRVPVDADSPDLILTVEGDAEVRGGFNAVAAVSDRVFASHSELGLREWNIDKPTEAKPRFESMTRNAKAVRAAAFCGGNLFASIDDRIIAWPADEVTDRPTRICTGSVTMISSLCPDGNDLFAGNSDGDILHWPVGQDSSPETIHRGVGRAAESVWLLASHGVRRLVFTDTSINIHARVLGDSFACRYEAGGQTLRRAEIAADVIVAMNELRDRLICWVPGKPNQPQVTIPVSRICGRSVQDICLVSTG